MAAAKEKNFSKVNISPVYDAIAEATEQLPGQMQIDVSGNVTEEAPAQEAQEAQEVLEVREVEKKQYKPRKTYTAEETLEALENMKTSGKKGVKLPRINLAFTPANYEFIRTMARVRGQSLTDFVNDMLAETRETHADIYNKAMEFRNSL